MPAITAVIPHLCVHNATAAIAYYTQAYGATEVSRMPADDGSGRLMHAELALGTVKLFLCDDFPEYNGGQSKAPKPDGGPGATLHLDGPDCDEAFAAAIAAGGHPVMPPADMFWGDRYAKVRDPFGYEWSFTTKLTPERTAAAMKAWEEMCQGK